VKFLLQALEERTVPTVSVFNSGNVFQGNYSGADAIQQAIDSHGANNGGHLVVYNDEFYADFTATTAGATNTAIFGRDVSLHDGNFIPSGPAVSAKPTVIASGTGTTVTFAATGTSLDNFDIVDGNSFNPVGVLISGTNTTISNSIIEQHDRGVVVNAGVNGLDIGNTKITGNTQEGIRFNGGTTTQNVNIHNDFITGNVTSGLPTYAGVRFAPTYSGNNVNFYFDDLSSNGGSGAVLNQSIIANSAGHSGDVNFSFDWFGSASGPSGATISGIAAPGTGAKVSNRVDITPYLVSGDSDANSNNGFQPDVTTLNVTNWNVQTGTLGRIQEGIGDPSQMSAVPGVSPAGGVAVGGTVNVSTGTFKENDQVFKAVTLSGANHGTAGSGTRGAESIVLTNGNQNALFRVTANNVIIDGFTINGDDPNVTGGTLFSGADSNATYGISNVLGAPGSGTTTNIANLTVENNIVKNVGIGVLGQNSLSAATASTGSLITANWFDSIGNFDFGYAVSLRRSFYADVTNNLMTHVWTGVHMNDFHLSGGPATWNVSGNTIHEYAAGLLYWLEYGSATSATFNNNQISPESGAIANNFGVLTTTVQGTVSPTFTNNTITGTDYGIGLTNVSTSNVITLGSTNSVSGTKVAGVYLTDNLTFNPVGTTDLTSNGYTGPSNAIAVNITGMPIAVTSGIGVKIETSRSSNDVSTTATINGSTISDTPATTTGIDIEGSLAKASISSTNLTGFTTGIKDNGGTLTVGAGNTITGGFTGLQISGATAILTGNTLGDLSFSGQTGSGWRYVVLSNGALNGQEVNATGASFDGFIGSAHNPSVPADLTSFYAKDDRIDDTIDAAGVGFVRLKAGDVFVTQQSENTNAVAIQRGINAATAGDTVYVQAGNFSGQVFANKMVTVLGANAGTAGASNSRVTETVIQAPAGGATELVISASDVTVDGFTIQGNTNGNNVGAGVYITPGVAGTRLKNSIIQNNVAGLFLANASATEQAQIVNNLFRDNTNAGGVNHGIYADQFTAGGAVSDVLIQGNTFTLTSFLEDAWGIGFSNTGATPFSNISIQNNTFGNAGRGMYFYNTLGATLSGNTIDGATHYGIGMFGNNGTPANGNFTITNNTFTNNGSGLELVDDSSAAAYTGPITATAFHDNTFASSTTRYIYNASATSIDATGTGNTYGGYTPTASNLAGQFALADKITDAIDVPGYGLVDIDPTHLNVYVTPNSFSVGDGTTTPSVQRGVNAAAAGDTVNVEAGTYRGQVSAIGKNLSIVGGGAASTILEAPDTLVTNFTTSGPNKAVVFFQNGVDSISSLTIDGRGVGDANNRLIGLAYHNAGGTVGGPNAADGVTIEHVRNNPLNGVQAGVALYAFNDDSVARSLTVTHNTIFDYQKNGMALSGTGLTVDVGHNTVTGAGATNAIAQNGIQVSFGAGGTVHDNSVSGDSYTPAPQSAGILLYQALATTSVSGNTVSNSDWGVYAYQGQGPGTTVISGNSVTGAVLGGAGLNIGDFDVTGNTLSGGADGVNAAGGATGTIHANSIHDNTGAGIHLAGSASMTVSNQTLTNNTIGILVEDPPVTPTTLTIGSGVEIDGGTTGLKVDGSQSAIAGNTLNNIVFNGQSTWYVDLRDGALYQPGAPTKINAGGATYDGVLGSSATQSQILAIEGKIHDYLADNTLGYINVQPGTIFVGPGGSIQHAVDLSDPNGTIIVAAGTFQENVNVYKPLTILGANAGKAGNDNTRGSESIVVTNGNQVAVWTITSSNVTIDGFKVEGDDPMVSGFALTSGNESNVLYGFVAPGAYSHLTIRNDIVENTFVGFRGDATASSAATSNTITRNWFDSIGFYDFGYAVTLRTNFYADVTNNLMTRVQSGLHTNDMQSPIGPAQWLFQGNTVQAYGAGVWDNQQYNQATPLTIDNNNINSLVAPGTAANSTVRSNYDGQSIGILLVTLQNSVGVNITNNTIDGMGYGLVAYNTETSNTVTIGATNTIKNSSAAGVYLTNIVGFNPVTKTELGGDPNAVPSGWSGPNNPTGAGKLSLNGVALTNNATGVLVRGDNAFTPYGVTLTVGNAGQTVTGGGTGLAFTGSAVGLTGNALDGLTFDGQTAKYVTLSNGALSGLTIIGSNATFDGFVPGTGTVPANLATYYGVEDRVGDYLDGTGVGYIQLKDGYEFVAVSSETPNHGSIQRAISVADAGDSVYVQAGLFTGDVDATKSLTFKGAQAGVDPTSGRAGPESTILGSGSVAPIFIEPGVNNVTLDGFTVTSPAGGSGSYNGGIVTPNSTGVTIQYDIVQNNTSGVVIGNSAGTIAHNVILGNNRQLGVAPGAGNGIEFYSGSNVGGWSITGNYFTGNDNGDVIIVPGEGASNSVNDVTIQNNQFINSTGNPIYAINADNLQVLGNAITGSTFTGIVLNGEVNNSSVTGNMITNGHRRAILMENSYDYLGYQPNSNVTISNNVIAQDASLITSNSSVTYDALNDFSVAGNPNGAWSYGDVGNINGTAFNLYTFSQTNAPPGLDLWGNNVGFPGNSTVLKNITNGTVNYATIVQPTNLLNLSVQNSYPDVRFTAPATGSYNINGLFERIDTASASHPTNVRVIKNGTTVLFSMDNLGGYAVPVPFSLNQVSLNAGDTIDFFAGPAADASFDSTGFEVTITRGVAGDANMIDLQDGTGGAIVSGNTITVTNLAAGQHVTGISLADDAATVAGSTIAGATTGIAVSNGTLTVGNGNSISNATTGMTFDGASSDVPGHTLSNTVFDNVSGDYITLSNGALAGRTINGTGVTYNGFLADNGNVPADLPSFYGTEDKITDGLDASGLGYIRLKNGFVFLSHGSENANIGSLQRAIDMSASGDTLYVQHGTFQGAVTVPHDLTIAGAKVGVDGRDNGRDPSDDTTETIVTDDGTNATIVTVTGGSVTLNGLTLEGNGVSNTGVAANGVAGVTVQNDIIQNIASNGVDVYEVQTLVVQDNLIQNMGYGGVSAGGGTVSLDNATIQNNHFTNLNTAISLYENEYGLVSNNLIDNPMTGHPQLVTQGIVADDYSTDGGTLTIDSNNITANDVGIRLSGVTAESVFSITNNTITGNGINGLDTGILLDGVQPSGVTGSVSVNGNKLYGILGNGIDLIAAGTYSNYADVSNNLINATISGSNGTGIFADNGSYVTLSGDKVYGYFYTGAGLYDSRANADHITISGSENGMWIGDFAQASVTTGDVTAIHRGVYVNEYSYAYLTDLHVTTTSGNSVGVDVNYAYANLDNVTVNATTGDLNVGVNFDGGLAVISGGSITTDGFENAGVFVTDSGSASLDGVTISTSSGQDGVGVEATNSGYAYLNDTDITIDGTGSIGVYAYGGTVVAKNSTISGNGANSHYVSLRNGSSGYLGGVTLTLPATGVGINVENSYLSLGSGNAISGGDTGIVISGSGSSLSGSGLNDITISGQSGDYVDLENGALYSGSPTEIDATNALFDGHGATSMTPTTLSQFYGIEDKVSDYLDGSAVGFVRLNAGFVYATQASETSSPNVIQRAVNVAVEGDEIDVQAGTYRGQVVVEDKGLSIVGAGAGSTTIESPDTLATNFTTSQPNKAIVFFETGGPSVVGIGPDSISSLTVDGRGVGDANYRLFGIAYHNQGGTVGGANAADGVTITRVRSGGVSGTLNGVQSGSGIFAYNDDSVARSLTISHNNIFDYQKNGMVLDGDGLTVDVGFNIVTGAGATPLIAQNGIQLSFGAGGSIHDNNISGNSYTGPLAADSTGVLLYQAAAGSTVTGNTISGNDFGVYAGYALGVGQTTISYNTISGSPASGIAAAGGQFEISRNTIQNAVANGGPANNHGDGIELFGDQTGTSIHNNLITNNSGIGIGFAGAPYTVTAGGPITVSSNSISGNGAGIDNESGATVNAADNWWGSANGPTNPSNPIGVGSQGDSIVGPGTTNFVPWLTSGQNDAPPGPGFIPHSTNHTAPVHNVNQDTYFLAIQPAVNAAHSGDELDVAAGTFNENVNVNVSVTIIGSGSGASGTIVSAGSGNVFTIAANNISLEHMRVTGSGASNGVYFDSTVDGTTLNDVVATGFSNAALEIHNNAVVTNLTLTNVDLLNSGVGFRIATTGQVNGMTVTNGHFNGNQYGLYTNADLSNVSAAAANKAGFQHISFSGTTFANNDAQRAIYLEKADDLTFTNITVTANKTGNVIDVNLKNGAYVGLHFVGGSITDSAAGTDLYIKARNDGSNASKPASLSGVTIQGTTFSSILGGDPSHSGGDLEFQNNVTLDNATLSHVTLNGTGFGIAFAGSDGASTPDMPSQTFLLNDSMFAGTLAAYVADTTHNNVDGTAATYGGIAGGNTLTDANGYAITDKILDGVDASTTGFNSIGLVRLKAQQVYVTPNSFYAPLATTVADVNRGVKVASAGDTVRVQAGSYTGDVDINKSLSLLGGQHDVDPVPTPGGRAGGESIIIGSGANAPILIESGVNNVTINGFTIKSPNAGSGALNGGIYTNGSTGVTINYDILTNNTAGVAIGNSGGTIAHNVIQTNNLSGATQGTGVYFFTGSSGGWSVSNNLFGGNDNNDVLIAGGATVSNVSVTNNQFTNSTGGPIAVYQADNVTISGNTLTNAAGRGIHLGGAVSNSSITGNSLTGEHSSAIALDNPYALAANSNITISNNTISQDATLITSPKSLIDIQSATGTTSVSGNTISTTNLTNQQITGITINGAGTAVTVQNNTIRGNTEGVSGVRTGIGVGSGATATLLGNTIHGGTGNGRVGLSISGTATLGNDTVGGANAITGWSSLNADGVLVTSTGAATLLKNTINGNNIGVLVNAGKALLQDNDLQSNNTNGASSSGVDVRNNALVDLGQGAGGSNFTGLGISQGGNLFNYGTGYTSAGAKAIFDENDFIALPTGSGPATSDNNVPALFNNFGTTVFGNIEQIVFHYYDSGKSLVDYRNAFGATAPQLEVISGSGPANPFLRVFAQDPAGFPVITLANQRSIIRAIQFQVDSPVALGAGATDMSRISPANLPWYASALPTGAVALDVSATVDGGTGRTIVTVRFTTPNNGAFNGSMTEWGSLIDGNYNLGFHGASAELLYAGSGATSQDHNESFFRFFGDTNGSRTLNTADTAILNQAKSGGQPAFVQYFDLNQNNAVDGFEGTDNGQANNTNSEYFRRLRQGAFLAP
jgi:parallel beta-helix repeat protein